MIQQLIQAIRAMFPARCPYCRDRLSFTECKRRRAS